MDTQIWPKLHNRTRLISGWEGLNNDRPGLNWHNLSEIITYLYKGK